MDYALSSGGGNVAASDASTTVETVQISNGVESCGNGNNGEPRGTTAYNYDCNAIDVNTQAGPMNTGARAPPREPPLAARSVPLLRLCAADEAPTPPLALPGKWCSTVGGRGGDNPNNPQELDEENRREKAVSFFFEAFSKFDVRDAPRSPHRRPPRWPCAAPGCTLAAARGSPHPLPLTTLTSSPTMCADDLIGCR